MPAPEPAPLLEHLATLRLENAALRAQNAVLQARSRDVEARLGQTSANSYGPLRQIRPGPQRARRRYHLDLVVEDKDAIRKLVADALSREGYPVAEAQNGAEALRRLDPLWSNTVRPALGMHPPSALAPSDFGARPLVVTPGVMVQ
ncbi:MAG TPA: hypothetical protein VII06_22580 [Chloroflexota bacterium]